jgi:ubiquinone/menaquinone biosynthesis C-methylase UbiE
MPETPTLYDTIGASYGATRRADSGILGELAKHVELRAGDEFLDLGCGTGNYTCALAAAGGQWHGVEPSAEMLEQAKSKGRQVSWMLADAQSLPYEDDTFAGAICTLAIHHFPALEAPFAEVARVLRAGKFVVFTAFPEQMQSYWLCHYFPRMMEKSIERMPRKETVLRALGEAGFSAPSVVPFAVSDRLQDLFLYSGKVRPQIYLSASVRSNISSFATLCPPSELEEGLERLRADIAEDRFQSVARQYASTAGDYAFVVAEKPGI